MSESIIWENPGLALLGIVAVIFLLCLLPSITSARRSREPRRDRLQRAQERKLYYQRYEDYQEDRSGPHNRRPSRHTNPARGGWFVAGICVGAAGMALLWGPPSVSTLTSHFTSFARPYLPATTNAPVVAAPTKTQDRLDKVGNAALIPPTAAPGDAEIAAAANAPVEQALTNTLARSGSLGDATLVSSTTARAAAPVQDAQTNPPAGSNPLDEPALTAPTAAPGDAEIAAAADAPVEQPPANPRPRPDPLGDTALIPPTAAPGDAEIAAVAGVGNANTDEMVKAFVSNLRTQLPMTVSPGVTMAIVDSEKDLIALGFVLSRLVAEKDESKLQKDLETRFRDSVCATKPGPANLHGLNDRGVVLLINYADISGKNVAELTVEPRFCSNAASTDDRDLSQGP